ncbi:MAG: efflux RND transporter periplasmic adaptor subunit [Wenzhouxiangella sp.]
MSRLMRFTQPIALRIALPIAIVVIAVVAAKFLARMGPEPERSEPEQAALLVDVVAPEISTGRFQVRGQGVISPKIETELVSEVTGRVIWVSDTFVAGGIFQADEVLAHIDPSDYQTALLAAEAELASAQATLADEQARSDAARDDFRRLYGDSRQPSELMLRLPQVQRARAAVQAQEAAVARARRELERTRIKLPFKGMVRERSVDLGQFVSAGSALGAAFGIERAQVRLPMAENDLAFLGIRPGMVDNINREVTLSASAAGNRHQWRARLVRTEGVINRNTRLTYLVAEIEDPYALLPSSRHEPIPIGTYVEAMIPGRDASGLAIIPSQAIHDGNQVYLADESDQLRIISVEVVRATPRESYVSADLSEIDRVVVTAIPTPIPGLRLNVRKSTGTEPVLRILPVSEEVVSTDSGTDS